MAFLRNTWYVAAHAHELADGRLLARTILGEPVLLYRGDSGRVVALDNRCAHRGAWLSNGRREGDEVRCMYHGLRFGADGRCNQIPGQENIPAGLCVRAYPVAARRTLVWIWMGDPALADESSIPDIGYLENPAWRGLPGYMHYDANYLLIVDNLADFAHLAFVHTKSLGGSEEYAFKSKPTAIERLADGFRVERWHENADCPPFHARVTPGVPKVDRRNIGHMVLPGIFFLESLFAPAGLGLRERGRQALGEQAREYRNCQFFTPETEGTTHFFWVYLHDYQLHDPAIGESLYHSMVEGFNEDKAIIEGQQRMLDADPDFRFHPIVADAALAHFRRLMDKRLAEEAQAAAASRAGQVAAAATRAAAIPLVPAASASPA